MLVATLVLVAASLPAAATTWAAHFGRQGFEGAGLVNLLPVELNRCGVQSLLAHLAVRRCQDGNDFLHDLPSTGHQLHLLRKPLLFKPLSASAQLLGQR